MALAVGIVLSSPSHAANEQGLSAENASHVTFGGSMRSRVNHYDNDRFGLLGGADGTVWMQRFYGHADMHFNDQFRAYIQLSSHLANATNQLSPGPFDRSDAAVSQAYIDWRHGRFLLRVGRQEMSLGSARLLSARDGPNVRLSYDGVRWDNVYGRASTSVFYLQEVKVQQQAFAERSSSNDAIWGLAGTRHFVGTSADVYYLGLKRQDAIYQQGVADETRHSVGTRLFGAANDWDWNVEALYQFGRFGDADIRAWTAASIVGYRFADWRGQPRLGLSANIASGDKNSNDQRLGTFNPIYPNLAYFDEAAIYAPQNFYNIEPGASWMLSPKLNMALAWNMFWRLEKQDAVYVRGLMPLPQTAASEGHFVAHTPSIGFDYRWHKQLTLNLNYSHFIAGKVIKQAGGGDVRFVRAQLEWRF